MVGYLRTGILSLALTGMLAGATGVALAQKRPTPAPPPHQTPTTPTTSTTPNTPPSSTDPVLGAIKADVAGDQQERAALRAKYEADRRKLRADLAAFGEKSPQVAADRAQLQQDKQALLALHADKHGDVQEWLNQRKLDRSRQIHRRVRHP